MILIAIFAIIAKDVISAIETQRKKASTAILSAIKGDLLSTRRLLKVRNVKELVAAIKTTLQAPDMSKAHAPHLVVMTVVQITVLTEVASEQTH